MRIQVRYWLYAFLSFLVVVAGVALLFLDSNDLLNVIFSGLVTLVGAVPSFRNLVEAMRWENRARRFWNAFGIEPPADPKMDWKELKMLQPVVDEKLKIEAAYLKVVFEAENKVLGEEPKSFHGAVERAERIAEESALVERQKKIFWGLRTLAWKWGFEVYGVYEDYISNPRGEKYKKQF